MSLPFLRTSKKSEHIPSPCPVRPPSGAQITSLISYAHDVDMYRAWARLMVYGDFDEEPALFGPKK